ncbi:MAG: hypothetical protein WCI04_00265 [archaeon]
MHISVKTKDRVFGETFNVSELISALQNDVFKEGLSPVTIQTENYQGRLIGIYTPKNTNEIHLLGNNYNLLGKLLYDKTEAISLISQIAGKVYLFNDVVGRGDVIRSLKEVPKDMKVFMETIADLQEGMRYTLTGVFKCSEECPAVHLDSSYQRDSFLMN